MNKLVRQLAMFFTLFFFFNLKISAQNSVFGLVTNDRSEIIPGALVFWKNDPKIGTATDAEGHFLLKKLNDKPAQLVIRYVGYEPTEVEVLPNEDSIWVEIKGITNIQEVVISSSQSGSYVSTIDTRSVEHITSRELKKAPCCNLSESFETTGSVDVTYSNAVTGTKEIQMLGLRGLYSQLMVESRPTLGGIAQPYAMEFIPGTWLSAVAISKGASTVMNGFGGITGSINVDLEKPETGPRFFANAFGSQEGRGELNLHFNKKLKKEGWSAGLLTHADRTKTDWDHNHDTFLDGPNKKQLNGLGRLFYESDPICFQLNVQALTDQRDGGQLSKHHPTGQGLWLFDQKIDRVEAWGKLGFKNFKHEYNQLGNMFGASMHKMTGGFGQNIYSGEQKSFYFQSIYATILGNTNHKINFAANFQGDDYRENLNFESFNRTEIVPGAEAEYTFANPNPKMGIADWTIVAGARIDQHNKFGTLFTPRLNAKYNFTENMVARISAGRGFRSPNVIAENIGFLASNRSFSGVSDLKIEEAWNFGFNFTRNFKLNGREGSMSFDAFHTDFVHQVVVDAESDFSKIQVYNLDGKSYSTSLLATFSQKIAPGLDIKLIAKMNDVKTNYQNRGSLSVPLVAKWRGLVTVDYETKSKKWMFNTRVGFIGTQRLPENTNTPANFLVGFAKKSPNYAMWSGQITRRFKKDIEIYLGGENLNDYSQHSAIISANDSASAYFNASQLWAPTMGRTIYGGVRWTIK
jgi:outer membrane receptor for ferrienterochelin and colicins